MQKAIILLSGGLDSTTTLYYAKNKGYKCHALIFDYGQRHKKEIKSAIKIAKLTKTPYQIVKIKLPWGGSVLLGSKGQVPRYKKMRKEIPPTYVPARNTIFLSFALSYAEAIGAKHIFIGANAIDYSGYPDCRPSFIKAFQNLISKGTRDQGIGVRAPLINKTKKQIVKLARKLKVPLELTWSCYKGGRKPCGVCDSCILREKGFST
ncbi:MAG: 7-cyano-7-deazaguanine synthase QueC [Candidatus Saganbacteria bacterium]|nr:7-cyano-7-deazaguanine synthase QueC [Candidatus Saganbacteria bacterium]